MVGENRKRRTTARCEEAAASRAIGKHQRGDGPTEREERKKKRVEGFVYDVSVGAD